MGHVSVTIDGKLYRMACEDGEEAHLIGLAGYLDRRVAELRSSFGEIGDMRLVVMAAVTITDELGELRKRITLLEEEASRRAADEAQTVEARRRHDLDLAAILDRLGDRVTGLAHLLSGQRPDAT